MMYVYTDLDVHFQSFLRFQSLGVPGNLPLMIIVGLTIKYGFYSAHNYKEISEDEFYSPLEARLRGRSFMPNSSGVISLFQSHQDQNSLKITKQPASHIMLVTQGSEVKSDDKEQLW